MHKIRRKNIRMNQKNRMIRITFAISVINLDPNVFGEISKCEAVSGRQHKLGRHQGAEAHLRVVLPLHICMEEKKNIG